MGGIFDNTGEDYNDLWKYDISLKQWAWIGGYNTYQFNGNAGPIGVESQDYFPSLRIYSAPITAPDGRIYIYGGNAPNSNEHSNRYDLWRYNPANNAWTLLYKPSNETQNIGQPGIEDSNNRPGILLGFTSWYYDNCLWFFGGNQEMITGTDTYQKKTWKYNLLTQKWACMKNPDSVDAVYGQQLVGDINNTPPYLIFMSNAVVYNNEAYFLGGFEPGGNTATYDKGYHNSLWKYNMLTNNWIWVKGEKLTQHPGFYGKMNVERSENLPFSRCFSFLWLDNTKLNLFAGEYDQVCGMDFWDFNLATNNYCWVDGITRKICDYYFEDLTTPSVYNIMYPTKLKWSEKGSKLWFISELGIPFHGQSVRGGMFEYDVATSVCHKIINNPSQQSNLGIYGEKGIPDPANIPPSRGNGSLWETDTKLYLLGGSAITYHFSDFWVFDKSTKMWTWINGAKYNETPYFHYSAIGVADPDNYPKAKTKTQTWVDADGNLWLFSGNNPEGYFMNDLWKFDTQSNMWILMGGDQNDCSLKQAYFKDTYPPFVNAASTWSHGNDLYFYGGFGLGLYNYNLAGERLSDVWKYSVSTNTWSKITGNRKIKSFGNYGLKQYGFISNVPGYRKDYASWGDEYGNLWIYGGVGVGETGTTEANLFDLWKFDISLNMWIWMDGLKNPQSWTADFFRAKDYNFPQRVSNSSVCYKGNGKYYVETVYGQGLWELDFKSYNKDYNIIEGAARFDMNGNCDTADIAVPNLKLKINNSDNSQFYTNIHGEYKIYTPILQNTLQAVGLANNNTYFNINPTSAQINFASSNNTYTQDFCISPKNSINDLEISIIPVTDAIPGFTNKFKIIYRNIGNTVLSGSVKFVFDDLINDFVSASLAPATQTTGALEWNFTDLSPFESRSVEVSLNLNSPSGNPPVNAGDYINLTGTVLPVLNDHNADDNTCYLNQLVVNSYDPNDKICLQGNTIRKDMVGKYVTYKIRFENKGTYPAQNVVIKDSIDTAKFDIQSIITLDASHDFTMLVTADNVLEYHFDNIYLPKSPSELRFGYIVFKIQLKSNLEIGNSFSNSANIYFDYNMPMETNEYVTTIQPLGIPEYELTNRIPLNPNPVKDILNFNTKEKVLKTDVYDVSGRIISSLSVNGNKMDLCHLKPGTYILKIYTTTTIKSAKIIKE